MSSNTPTIIEKLPESIMRKPKFEDQDKPNNISNSNMVKFNSFNTTLDNNKQIDSARKDKYGNPILKKNKIHKISFSDQFNNERSLVQISKIESYKTFNNAEEQEKKCLNCILC